MVAARPPLTPVLTAALMICTRDRPNELAACLASCAMLLRPAGMRVVICVADNNAVPCEEAIRNAAASLGLDLLYGHEPERGYASVRNLALDLAASANADLAVFIDDDSTAHPGLVAAHADAMKRYGADAILGRIDGLSQRPVEGRRVTKAGTGNVSMRRWVYDTVSGLGLRFDTRLNLLGFEDWEFFSDLVTRGGIIFQSIEPISISAPTIDAAPASESRAFDLRLAFARMEGRNEIAVTRLRHGLPAAAGKAIRRHAPLLMRGVVGFVAQALKPRAPGRGKDVAKLRIAKSIAAFQGLRRPGFERPQARLGRLIEVSGT